MKECKLDAIFTKSVQGLGLALGFTIPDDVDPITELQIDLAPQELSDPDRHLFYKILSDHLNLIQSQDGLMDELKQQYEQKTVFQFNPNLLIKK